MWKMWGIILNDWLKNSFSDARIYGICENLLLICC